MSRFKLFIHSKWSFMNLLINQLHPNNPGIDLVGFSQKIVIRSPSSNVAISHNYPTCFVHSISSISLSEIVLQLKCVASWPISASLERSLANLYKSVKFLLPFPAAYPSWFGQSCMQIALSYNDKHHLCQYNAIYQMHSAKPRNWASDFDGSLVRWTKGRTHIKW